MVDFKAVNQLNITKNFELAGSLNRTTTGCQFTLNSQFIKHSTANYFSYCITKESPQIITEGDNLPPFFAGLLPEGRRLNALINKIKTSKDDLFSLFAGIGHDCIGDINIEDKETGENHACPLLKDVDFYSYFEELIAPESTMVDINSLAGVQEKISASMISFPLNIAKRNAAYILKLNPIDKNNLIQNELNCLNLARKCGFKVAKAKMVFDKQNNPGLLVERFDRVNKKKLHQEDACQFLNRYPADKYRISINQIADALLKIAPAPQLEILTMLCQYAFSYLICNGDLHAKNISLQTLEDETITLTPMYDLICTAIYGDFKMALKLDGKDDNIKRKNFITFAKRYDVSEKAIVYSLDNLLQRFVKNYKDLFVMEMAEKKSNLLQRMIIKRLKDLG